MAVQISKRIRVVGLFGFLYLHIAMMTGCASDRVVYPSPRQTPEVTNVVQRPTYSVPGTKPLYLGGYAGANYDRGMRARP